MADYTHVNIEDVEDMAAKHGFGDAQEARFPFQDLEAEQTGFGHVRVKPNQRQPFAHRHQEAEEIYLVLSGSGRLKLDDEMVELKALDAVRISPSVGRALEAGDEGIEVLAFGPRAEGDAEMIKEGFWEN